MLLWSHHLSVVSTTRIIHGILEFLKLFVEDFVDDSLLSEERKECLLIVKTGRANDFDFADIRSFEINIIFVRLLDKILQLDKLEEIHLCKCAIQAFRLTVFERPFEAQ